MNLFKSAIEAKKLELKQAIDKNDVLVFYGFAKLTKKIVRKRSIVIMFENSKIWNAKKDKFIKQKMHIVHIRKQTSEEALDAKGRNREWQRFDIFVDSKYYKGNLERALESNYLADINNVSKYELDVIRQKLREQYHDFYKIDKRPTGQQPLIFY